MIIFFVFFCFTVQGGMVMYLFFISTLRFKYSYLLMLAFLVLQNVENSLYYFKLPPQIYQQQ